MSLFEDAKPVRNQHRKVTPYYQVIVIGDEDNAYNHEPGCTVEAVPVGKRSPLRREEGQRDHRRHVSLQFGVIH
jgi:hypothetical protein